MTLLRRPGVNPDSMERPRPKKWFCADFENGHILQIIEFNCK